MNRQSPDSPQGQSQDPLNSPDDVETNDVETGTEGGFQESVDPEGISEDTDMVGDDGIINPG